MKQIFLLLSAVSLLFGAYTRDAATQTVYDDQTDLTWQDDGNVSSQTMTWEAAIDYCENLDFAGEDDWRVPNFNELYMIADHSTYDPAMHMDAVNGFQNVSSNYYWSSTTYALDTGDAWGVNFNGGNVNWHAKSSRLYVRCVRGGQIAPSAVTVPLSPAAKALLALLFGLGGVALLRRRRQLL